MMGKLRTERGAWKRLTLGPHKMSMLGASGTMMLWLTQRSSFSIL
jgi:hypothetical protein